MDDELLSKLMSNKLNRPSENPHKDSFLKDSSLKTNLDNSSKSDKVVVSEIPITGAQLHSIAAGNYCLLGQKGEPFAVRFMLKSSFKVPKNNFVVRNIVMQIVAVGKDNVMRREDMATDVKIIKTKAKVSSKPVKEEMQFKVNDDKKELF